jgi:fructose-bisphosphate aldolase class II
VTRLTAIITDRLDGTAFHGFFALGFFFGSTWLFENVGIPAVIVAGEIIGRRFTAQIAIDALVINVVLARSVLWIPVSNVSHKSTQRMLGGTFQIASPLLRIGVGARTFYFLFEERSIHSPAIRGWFREHFHFCTIDMPLTHTKELFAKALKGKYALGAFNVNNMELLQAIIEACEEEKAPVMLQISRGARQYANPVYLKKLIEAAVSLSNIPIAVHLDHGDSFELCKECIDEGFTSVMIDGSHEAFDKNVEVCRKVVEYAHKHNCVVEGELGMLVGAQHDDGEEGGGYSKGGVYTHPDEAVEFVKQTGVDSLAVAIGNSHGAYKFKGEQHLDLERLKAIKKALMDAGLGDYPLVLHGASSVPKDIVLEVNKYGGRMGEETAGVPEADIEVARRVGCTKVNIDTDLRLAMTAAIRKAFAENPKEFDPRKYLGPARTRVKELVRHKVRDVLCCAGHAFD